jgi:deoxyribodipyrimidine photo-lyase
VPSVPELRIRAANHAPIAGDGAFVLYWMIASRRTDHNFALDRAIEWALRLDRPVVVLEALRVGYAWASDRLHAFVLQGMADNQRRLAGTSLAYYPYVEPEAGAGTGLVAELARRAAVVVTDDFPAFFLPRMVGAAAARCPVRVEAIDSNGILPLVAADRCHASAYAFRRFLQRSLREHLPAWPAGDPVQAARLRPAQVPGEILNRWPAASAELLTASPGTLASLPIDHRVGPGACRGGATAARAALDAFLDRRLPRYDQDRNQPQEDVASGLSPYLHFGHISAHDVFARVMAREGWTTRRIASRSAGQREGWWGASPAAESFLDQLVTWREVGSNMCHHRDDHDTYESLPDWARATLEAHAADPRVPRYWRDDLEGARTHDPLWNAAQRQLVREGRMHNYLRMLWGKKILEWTGSPREALAVMIALNDKYALDGRDPNSYSGICWVLGRYDRPWAPERPIFGRVRYMSSENTARKLRVRDYIRRYAP